MVPARFATTGRSLRRIPCLTFPKTDDERQTAGGTIATRRSTNWTPIENETGAQQYGDDPTTGEGTEAHVASFCVLPCCSEPFLAAPDDDQALTRTTGETNDKEKFGTAAKRCAGDDAAQGILER
ncbi:LOW QUALITY PROTEIN: hypothetical protein Ct61P_06157 [Colletotrichum tofieldiae]|nr:LOW QUALITY PROTEIN: hypothetical protein Ct61P_06157 [Colletotrichum tofieldiae]